MKDKKKRLRCLADTLSIRLCARHIKENGIEGAICEIGVYGGGSARLLCTLYPDRTIHLFDTYAGIPKEKVSPIDGHAAGDFHATLAEVKDNLSDFQNTWFHVGIFPDSAVDFNQDIAFLHLDCDVFLTAVDAMEWAWPRLVPRGVIQVDDYGFTKCKGVKKAVDDFVAVTDDLKFEKRGQRVLLWKHANANIAGQQDDHSAHTEDRGNNTVRDAETTRLQGAV